MPIRFSCAASPIPESCKSCGDCNGPGCKDDLAVPAAADRALPSTSSPHRRRVRSLEQNSRYVRAGDNRQVLSRADRMQECNRRTRSPTAADARVDRQPTPSVVAPLKSELRGKPYCIAASTHARQSGWSLRSSETSSSPSAPRNCAAGHRSVRAAEVRQHVARSPAHCARRAQSSKSSCWPRMKISPLIELEPPRMRPRGHAIARPAVPSDGSV